MPAVARAAQPHVAEPLSAGKCARLLLVEQPRRVRQLPESGKQSAVRPPLDGEPVAAAQAEYGVLLGLLAREYEARKAQGLELGRSEEKKRA